MPAPTEGFYKAVWYFVAIIVFAAPVVALGQFVESRLVLEWRRWLCADLLKVYFANRGFFKLHRDVGNVDNPDQVMIAMVFIPSTDTTITRFQSGDQVCIDR